MADAGVKIPTFSQRSSSSGRSVERRNILAVNPCGTTSAGVTARVTWPTAAGGVGQDEVRFSCGPTLYANSKRGGVPSLYQMWMDAPPPAGLTRRWCAEQLRLPDES